LLDFFFKIAEVTADVVLIFAGVFLLTIAEFELKKKQRRKEEKEYLEFRRHHLSGPQAQRHRR